MLGFIMSIIVQVLFLFSSIMQVIGWGGWSDWMVGIIALNLVLCFCTWLSWKEYKGEL